MGVNFNFEVGSLLVSQLRGDLKPCYVTIKMSESCESDEETNVFERGKEYRKPHTKILKNAKSHNYSGVSSRSYAGAGYSRFNWAGPNKRSCAYHKGRYIAP